MKKTSLMAVFISPRFNQTYNSKHWAGIYIADIPDSFGKLKNE